MYRLLVSLRILLTASFTCYPFTSFRDYAHYQICEYAQKLYKTYDFKIKRVKECLKDNADAGNYKRLISLPQANLMPIRLEPAELTRRFRGLSPINYNLIVS